MRTEIHLALVLSLNFINFFYTWNTSRVVSPGSIFTCCPSNNIWELSGEVIRRGKRKDQENEAKGNPRTTNELQLRYTSQETGWFHINR